MKNLIVTLVLSLFLINVYSQDADSPINIKKRKYYQNDQKLNRDQLYTALANNPASTAEFQNWRRKEKIGAPITYTGLGLVVVGAGVGLATNLESGLGIMVAGLVIEIVGSAIIIPARKKHLNPAIDLYNSSLSSIDQRSVIFELMSNSNGVGVRLRF